MEDQPIFLEVDAFDWDEANTEHLLSHGVTVDMVEEVRDNRPLFIPNVEGRAATHVMVGVTDEGRHLRIAISKCSRGSGGRSRDGAAAKHTKSGRSTEGRKMNDRFKKAAEEEDALKDSGREFEGMGEPVPARVRQNADSVYSIRFTKDELRELRTAAEAKGMKLSEVIRNGALALARSGEPASAVADVRAKVRELSEAVSRL